MFFSFGVLELIVLSMLSGPLSMDLVSFLNAEAYFQNNNVPVQADKLIEVASKAPADPKGRLAQLLAIRWLEENAAKLGEHKQATQTALQKLAQGPQGFARDYATRALARIEGRPVPVLYQAPKDSLRQALEWFPEDMTFVAALELRPAAGQKGLPDDDAPLVKDLRGLLAKVHQLMGPRASSEMYKFAEAVGNLRIDRISVAYDAHAPRIPERRIIWRVTGAGDGRALLNFVQQTSGRGTIKEEKGPKGESILVLTHDRDFIMAVIDNIDLIFTAFEGRGADHEGFFRQVLDVRAGKKASVLKGALGKDVQTVRPEARGLLTGLLPAELRRELANSPLGVTPERVTIDLAQQQTAAGFALSLRFRGTMEKEADAKALIDGFNTLKLMAVKGLDELGKPKDTLALKKAIQAAVLKGDGMTVTGEASISAEAIQAGLRLVMESIPKDIRP